MLTANHCVLGVDGVKLPDSDFQVVLGRTNMSNLKEGTQYPVDRVLSYGNAGGGNADIALLHLSGALISSARPLPLAPSGYVLGAGAGVTDYGYGLSAVTYDANRKPVEETASDFLRVTKAGSYVASPSCDKLDLMCFADNGPSAATHGDSGGPVVTATPDPFVVGVVHGGYDFSAADLSYLDLRATDVSVPAIHDWLVNSAKIDSGVAGNIYLDKATGASWLFGSDRFLHPVPDATVLACLEAAGDAVQTVGPDVSAFNFAELPRDDSSPVTCTTTPPPPPPPATVNVTSATGDWGPFPGPGGTVWVASDVVLPHQVSSVAPGSLAVTTDVYNDLEFASAGYQGIPAFDGAGNLWLPYLPNLGGNGLERLTPGTGAIAYSKIASPCGDAFPSSDGTVWAACGAGGTIYQIADDGTYTSGTDQGEAGLFPGTGGTMWGAARLAGGPVQVAVYSPGNPITAQTATVPGITGLTLIGADGGGMAAAATCTSTSCPAQCDSQVYCFVQVDSSGSLTALAADPGQLSPGAVMTTDSAGNIWGLTVNTSTGTNILFEVPAGGGAINQYTFTLPAPNASATITPASSLVMSDGSAWFLQLQAPYSGQIIEVTP